MTTRLTPAQVEEISGRYPWGEPSVPYGCLTNEGQVIRQLLSHVAALEGELCKSASGMAQMQGGWNARGERIASLESDLAACRRDQARYQWLRAHWDEPEVQKLHPWDEFSPDPDQLDEQIDIARSSQK